MEVFSSMAKDLYYYEAEFRLDGEVEPEYFMDAFHYLSEDNFVDYLHNENLKEKVFKIIWSLEKPDSGVVKIYTNEELNDNDLTELEDFIFGQKTDGLGEGFEQQVFGVPFVWDMVIVVERPLRPEK